MIEYAFVCGTLFNKNTLKSQYYFIVFIKEESQIIYDLLNSFSIILLTIFINYVNGSIILLLLFYCFY